MDTPRDGKGHNPLVLPATTLIRDVYRALIHTGRSYAAFTEKDIAFLERLRGVDEILDPMAGYGLLMQSCAEIWSTFLLRRVQFAAILLANPLPPSARPGIHQKPTAIAGIAVTMAEGDHQGHRIGYVVP
jgi:hypothetical protein